MVRATGKLTIMSVQAEVYTRCKGGCEDRGAESRQEGSLKKDLLGRSWLSRASEVSKDFLGESAEAILVSEATT